MIAAYELKRVYPDSFKLGKFARGAVATARVSSWGSGKTEGSWGKLRGQNVYIATLASYLHRWDQSYQVKFNRFGSIARCTVAPHPFSRLFNIFRYKEQLCCYSTPV